MIIYLIQQLQVAMAVFLARSRVLRDDAAQLLRRFVELKHDFQVFRREHSSPEVARDIEDTRVAMEKEIEAGLGEFAP